MTEAKREATARYYTDEVGEWTAVLTVLIDRETQPYRLAKLRELRAAAPRMRAHDALVEALREIADANTIYRAVAIAEDALASLTDEPGGTDG
jgi:hypothetical protein